MSLIPPRLSSATRYLLGASPPYKWRLSLAECPLCRRSYFLSLRADPFMTRCLGCKATVTNLSLIPVIKHHFSNRYDGKVAYELSTYGSTLNWMKKNFSEVVTSEFVPDKPLGQLIDGFHKEDVQRLSFADETFDVVSSNQVFEHVPDDIQGFKECLRVLRDGGAMVLSVPLFETTATERIAILEQASVVFLGKPEYHDSRIGGAKSAPVFWHHSISDIADRIRSVGFRTSELIDVTIAGSQRNPAKVIYAVK
jgi:SAM-dependent methyltransferase